MTKDIKDTIIPLVSSEKPFRLLTDSEWENLDKAIIEMARKPTEEEVAAAIKKAESPNATREERMDAWLMGWDIDTWDEENEWINPEPDAPAYNLSGLDALISDWESSSGQIDDLDD